MMELTIQLIPTGEIILSPGKNGENYCHSCKVSAGAVSRSHLETKLFTSFCFCPTRGHRGQIPQVKKYLYTVSTKLYL